jgi:hypothetical protein
MAQKVAFLYRHNTLEIGAPFIEDQAIQQNAEGIDEHIHLEITARTRTTPHHTTRHTAYHSIA